MFYNIKCVFLLCLIFKLKTYSISLRHRNYIESIFMKRLTQQQAEEQCRLLRLKRNADTQEADAIYQQTIQTLFDAYTEESKRLDSEIIRLKSEVTKQRGEMAEAWKKAMSDAIANRAMGIVVAPYKERIAQLSLDIDVIKSEKKYLTQHYEHNRRVAVGIRDAALREAQEAYHIDRMQVMENVVTKQPDYWREKYEALKAEMEMKEAV